MDTELVEGSEVRAECSETRAEGSSKRAGEDLQQESTKKQKVDEDRETSKLQSLMEVIPEEEEVTIDAIPLATKPLKEFDLLKWDPIRDILQLGQQVVSELVALRSFARRYGSRFCTHGGCMPASKVPMIKPGEFELWRMRIEQYIQMIDYSLWEVIENGNTTPKTTIIEGVEKVMPPTTAEEKA
ncbi:hypothetical protein Tco_0878450 [Tanacetum coccineum]|uniref:Uncharacterized protein n=1 Tax=Tanacetum coccineum TaxID=301880 RepID=A0ABQ5BZS2_9ASTR